MVSKKKLSLVKKQKTTLKHLTLGSLLAYCIWALIAISTAVSLGPTDISTELTSGESLVVDSNKGCYEGPHAAYVSFEVCNSITTDLDSLSALLGDFSNPLFGLAGGQAPLLDVGTLTGGECRSFFWYIHFDCSAEKVTSDITLKVFNTSGDTISQTVTLTTISTINAGAGGRIIGKGIIGEEPEGDTIAIGIEYSVGNIKEGSPIIFQPAGNLDFNAGCYQMVGSKIILSEISDIVVGDRNHLYYSNLSQHTGHSHVIQLQYLFLPTCLNGTNTVLEAYSAALSGGSLKRYSVGTEEASSGATLGVDWKWIEAKLNHSIVSVSWETHGLPSGELLTVERSVDGLLFKALGQIGLKNEKKNAQVFTYKDTLPLHLQKTAIYYRIKHTDNNGISSYSQVQEMVKGSDELSINLYPNPAESFVNVSFENLVANQTTIKIFNLFGEEVYQHSINTQGLSFYKIPVENLPTGKYILHVLYDQDIAIKSFLKH